MPSIRAYRKIVSKHFPGCVVALVGVGRECRFRGIEFREEGESRLASGNDLSMVDHLRSADQLPEIIPIERGGVVEFRQESLGIETIACLPELEHDEPTNERSVQGALGKHAEVVDVSCLSPLIAGPDFLGDDLGQSQALMSAGSKGRCWK